MAVLLPLFFAVHYAARYGDLQQRATQASRYAAFQRVMQPSSAKLSNATIEDQMRARFFLEPKFMNSGLLQSDDSAVKLKDANGQPALWRDLAGKALLESPAQVNLTWATQPLGSGKIAATLGTVTKLVGKSYPGGQQAMVELQLFNRLNLADATPPAIKIGATTAAAGNGLGSAGSADTRNAAAKVVPATLVPSVVTDVISLAVGLFERAGPEFGCIKPDVVASHRLEGAPNNSVCK